MGVRDGRRTDAVAIHARVVAHARVMRRTTPVREPWRCGIVEILVAHAERAGQRERTRDVARPARAVWPSEPREMRTPRVDGAPNEALVRPIAVRDLEGDAGRGERARRRAPRAASVQSSSSGMRREARAGTSVGCARMSTGISRGEALERSSTCASMYVVGREPVGQAPREGVDERAVGQPDGVQRADAVREAPRRDRRAARARASRASRTRRRADVVARRASSR